MKVPDYLKLVAGEVRERQARTDLTELTEAGYFQRVGAGYGVRPHEEGSSERAE